VSDSLLDPLEMEAIQAAIRETSPRRSFGALEHEPTRLALISDDRIADAARPVLLNLGTRWIRAVTRALRAHLPGSWQLDVVGAEVIDGATAKEELRGGWVAGMRADNVTDPAAPHPELVLAAHGGVIDIASAKRCGAADRPPTPRAAVAGVAPAVPARRPRDARELLAAWHRSLHPSWRRRRPRDRLDADRRPTVVASR
jgi:hypothetical protein